MITVLCILSILQVRVWLVYKARLRMLTKIDAELARNNLVEVERLLRVLDSCGSYSRHVFMITKWTDKQFFGE